MIKTIDTTQLAELARQRVGERARCKTDKQYLSDILGYDFQPDVHTELFDQLIPFDAEKNWVEQSTVKNRLILWPRGHYKSTAAIVECIQAVINNPDVRILIMRGGLRASRAMMEEIQSHFLGRAHNSRFSELFPEFCTAKNREGKELGPKKALELTADKFTTPARIRKQLPQPTVSIASPKSLKTSQHYDMGIFDDLVHELNYRNVQQLDKVCQDFDNAIPLIDPGGYRYVIGTRWAFGDLPEVIQRRNKGEWTVSLKTCWDDKGGVRFPARLARDNRSIGFTREQLEQIRADDAGLFAANYLNMPVAAGTQLFSKDMMIEARVDPANVPGLSQAALFVDLASTDEAKSDDSVIVCGKVDFVGRIYAVDIRGGKWLPSLLALHVIDMALKHRPMKVMFEKTASCIYFVEYLRVVCREKNVTLPIDFIKVDNKSGAKAVRVSSMIGHMKQKRLQFFNTIDPEVWGKMMKQFTEFAVGTSNHQRHDDYPDTIALMCIQFGAQVTPMIPLSQMKHPLLLAIEQQGFAKHVMDTEKSLGADEMGSDYSY